MRRRLVSRRGSFLLAAGAVALGIAACGLDESGLSVGDAAGPDGNVLEGGPLPDNVVPIDVQNDVALPPSCLNTDLSCILDSGLPEGWSPYVLVADGGGCPVGDFEGSTWETNVRLDPSSCGCGCSMTASWSCPDQVPIATGNGNCNGNGSVSSGVCQNQSDDHVQLTDASVKASGAACSATTGAPVVDTDPVSLCSAGCDAGFCAQPAGTRCIATDGDQACPAGLTKTLVGSGGDPSCDACTCSVGTAPTCTASATLYYGYKDNTYPFDYHANTTCSTQGGYGADPPFTLDGTCQGDGHFYNFDSYKATWNPPSATTCNKDQQNAAGDAGLASPKTVCCN